MTELRHALTSLSQPHEPGLDDEVFVLEVLRKCREAAPASPEPAPSPPVRLRTAPSRVWRWGALMAAAAGALWLTNPRVPEGVITPRGAAVPAVVATVEAYVGRAEPGQPLPLLQGQLLAPGDGIVIRYSNPSTAPAYLLVFALDRQGDVHWLHPAYLDESTDPASVELLPNTGARALDEVAEPEAPAAGELRLYAVLSREPLHVKDVERRLATRAGGVAQLFPGAEVAEWSCQWRVR